MPSDRYDDRNRDRDPNRPRRHRDDRRGGQDDQYTDETARVRPRRHRDEETDDRREEPRVSTRPRRHHADTSREEPSRDEPRDDRRRRDRESDGPSRRHRGDTTGTNEDPRAAGDDDFSIGTLDIGGFQFPNPGDRLYAREPAYDDRRPGTAGSGGRPGTSGTVDTDPDDRPFTPPDRVSLRTYVTRESPRIQRVNPNDPSARTIPEEPALYPGEPYIANLSPERVHRRTERERNDPRYPPRPQTDDTTDRRRRPTTTAGSSNPAPSDNTSRYLGTLSQREQEDYHNSTSETRRSQLRDRGKKRYLESQGR